MLWPPAHTCCCRSCRLFHTPGGSLPYRWKDTYTQLLRPLLHILCAGMDTCNSCTDLRCEGKNYLTAYLAMWGLEAQMSARSLGSDHGLYIVLQSRSRQWLQQRHSPLRNVNHFNEYKQVSLTDTLVLAGLNSRKVVSVSLAPSINEPLALLGGWIEEEAWKVTKTGSTSRRKITHWERKTKWKITP